MGGKYTHNIIDMQNLEQSSLALFKLVYTLRYYRVTTTLATAYTSQHYIFGLHESLWLLEEPLPLIPTLSLELSRGARSQTCAKSIINCCNMQYGTSWAYLGEDGILFIHFFVDFTLFLPLPFELSRLTVTVKDSTLSTIYSHNCCKTSSLSMEKINQTLPTIAYLLCTIDCEKKTNNKSSLHHAIKKNYRYFYKNTKYFYHVQQQQQQLYYNQRRLGTYASTRNG
jgi:hypothetical protein